MGSKFKKLIRIFLTGNYKYLFTKSIFITNKDSVIEIGKRLKLVNSNITVLPNSSLKIGDNCHIKNISMVINGTVVIGDNNIIENGNNVKSPLIRIDGGSFTMGFNNKIKCDILVRFNGALEIGNYNNINEESEIRADELVKIGSFNQISYKCNIWDTNTHNIYTDEERRNLTIKHFPVFGFEYEKPSTKPIIIGSDCWIGQEVSILKGVSISDSSIVGFRTLLTNCTINNNIVVVSTNENVKFNRKTK